MKAHPIDWIFGPLLFAIGVANLVLVHPVPGLAFIALSLVYTPLAPRALGIRIPLAVKLVAGIAAIGFTLGVSDLGDMID